MIGSQSSAHVRNTSDQLDRQRCIRELNDQLRRYARSGIICVTAGVQALGEHGIEAALATVRDFDTFTAGNDPYEEHDLGTFRLLGTKLMWKIDYYDRERRIASPDPADPSVTTRVLTIMLASEY